MKLRWSAALGAPLCALVVAACGDVPVLPQWDADWYVPMPSQSVDFGTAFGGSSVPANFGFPFSYTDSLDMNGAIGDLLQKDLRSASVIMGLSKHTQVSTTDTLFVGESDAALTAGNTRTILFVLNMTVSDTGVTDTTVITANNIQMLTDVANSPSGKLHIKVVGRASTGSSPVTLTSADSLAIRTALVARIAMSR